MYGTLERRTGSFNRKKERDRNGCDPSSINGIHVMVRGFVQGLKPVDHPSISLHGYHRCVL